MKRKVAETVIGSPAIDGAGVHLVRVLGPRTMYRFDPFLMLDAFDSKNPRDYIKGFPYHPHRGIETFTYLMEGRMDHRDSLGHAGAIHGGESQWMTAGSGIMHEEMPQPSERMLGLQLWLNLPAAEKMTVSTYFSITNDLVQEVTEEGSKVRVIAGEYKGKIGAKGHHLPLIALDVTLEASVEFTMSCHPNDTLFVYIVSGSASFADKDNFIPQKRAVRFGPGDEFYACAGKEGVRFFLSSAPPLKEPIAWGGPIVMNTEKELQQAFDELDAGTFIKHRPAGE